MVTFETKKSLRKGGGGGDFQGGDRQPFSEGVKLPPCPHLTVDTMQVCCLSLPFTK